MIIFCFYLFIYFDNQEHGLCWESIRLVNPIKKKKKKAGENKYLKDFFMIIERLQFFIIYDKKNKIK